MFRRDLLIADIDIDEARFFEINSYRNPFRNVEYYIVPGVIAVAAFIIAKVVDMSCSTDLCEVVFLLCGQLIITAISASCI